MNEKRRFGCILLAAGLGKRFGGGKLQASFHGSRLYELAMDTIPSEMISDSVVVSASDDILAEAEKRGLKTAVNPAPEDGISLSIRLGLEALPECSAVLFLVGDQPLLRRETVQDILRAGEEHPEDIIVPVRGDGQSGNPCLFPMIYREELTALQGDRGGKVVIRAHPEHIFRLPVREIELTDTDSKEALSSLEKM